MQNTECVTPQSTANLSYGKPAPPQCLITSAVLKQQIKDIVILQYFKIQAFHVHKCLQGFEVFGAFS